MIYYPITIPTLNRFEKLKNCIESLARNEHALETELVIGLDYPPNKNYFEGYKKIESYLNTISGFRKVTVIKHKKNMGVSENNRIMREYVFSNYDAFIYTEDDNIFSPTFISFINEGLDYYREDNSVIGICGYSYPIDWNTNKDALLQHQYFPAWGYGGWKNKEDVLAELLNNEKILFSNTYKKLKYIDWKKTPLNFYQSVPMLLENKRHLCDSSKSFLMITNNFKVLMPRKSLVINDGWDGSGIHCKENMFLELGNKELYNHKIQNIKNADYIDYSLELERLLSQLIPIRCIWKTKLLYFLIRFFGITRAKSIFSRLKKMVKG